jgi:hypothetical protein
VRTAASSAASRSFAGDVGVDALSTEDGAAPVDAEDFFAVTGFPLAGGTGPAAS